MFWHCKPHHITASSIESFNMDMEVQFISQLKGVKKSHGQKAMKDESKAWPAKPSMLSTIVFFKYFYMGVNCSRCGKPIGFPRICRGVSFSQEDSGYASMEYFHGILFNPSKSSLKPIKSPLNTIKSQLDPIKSSLNPMKSPFS